MNKFALKNAAAFVSKTVGGRPACDPLRGLRDRDMTFEPGEVVRVVGIENITLIVAASFVINSES
jgi:hypothetical protein